MIIARVLSIIKRKTIRPEKKRKRAI